DSGLAVDAKHRLRRVRVGSANFGNVAQPDQPPVRQEVDREEVLLGPKRAGHLKQKLLVTSLYRASRADSVLRLQRRDQGSTIDAEAGELPRRELDKDLLVLRADDLDTGDIGNVQQARANLLDVIAQIAMRETLRAKTVNQPVGVAEVVIETRSYNAGGQRMPNIAYVLSNLIPDVRHLGRRRRSLQVDENCRAARAGVAAQEIQTLDLLQL